MIRKILISGLLATIFMSAFQLIVLKMDMGMMLGPMNPIMVQPYIMGWVMHFMIGAIIAGIYGYFFHKRFSERRLINGAAYGSIVFILAQLTIVPMMGMGFFSGGNIKMLLGSLISHVIYGLVLGIKYNPDNDNQGDSISCCG
ncbi:MAG: hypothetical protein HOG33_05310 [Candidatus Marinimicrobia bacterium]|nr:hypothetical protein [Candidatus Neomarinimicrobiota bacterium]